MKSGRQRRAEIAAKRKKRGSRSKREIWPGDDATHQIPKTAVMANQELLLHDNTWGPRPLYYVDIGFACASCLKWEVWTATQQKWWYEVAKSKIGSTAKHCRSCRRRERERRTAERQKHVEGLVAKYGIEAAAERLKMTVHQVDRLRVSQKKKT